MRIEEKQLKGGEEIQKTGEKNEQHFSSPCCECKKVIYKKQQANWKEKNHYPVNSVTETLTGSICLLQKTMEVQNSKLSVNIIQRRDI